MVSSIAITAAEGFEPDEKPRLIDKIATNSERNCGPTESSKEHEALRRPRRGGTPQVQRGPPDDLEERIGPKLIYSISELAALADRSPATIFRLLRLGQLQFVWVSSSRCFTRAIVLDFLRRGTRRSEAA
jgi:hypothetical protein